MVQDFNFRLERIFAFKEENGIPVDLFVGGPDAYAALRNMLRRFRQVGNLPVFVCNSHRGHLMTVTVAVYHPSAGITSGDPTIQRDIRDQFVMYKTVCAVADQGCHNRRVGMRTGQTFGTADGKHPGPG